MSKDNLIPKLRFPEFVNEGEWLQQKLGEIGEPLMCKRILKEQTTTNPKNGIPFYKIGTFGKEADAFIPIELFEDFKSKYSFPRKGDILISAAGTIGRLVVYDGLPAYFQDSNIVWLGNDESKVLNGFLFYCYSTIKWQTSDGGIISRLYNSDLKNIKISFSKKTQEQQKIASCLSSLDEVIAAHSQKLDLLKDHKKGLMQNLFPQEGVMVPKFRFKEFENDGEWVEKKLGEIAEIITGSTPKTSELAYYGGNKMFVSPADISDNRIVSQTKTTLTELGFSKTRQIKAGSVLFVCIGSTIGKVAQNKFECATNQQINSLVAKKNYSSDFLYSLLDANSTAIASIAGNHAVPIINKSSFSDILLFFPHTLQEQQKIAFCLSSLDALITAQAEKIEQLKLHKKGLMQGLFPKSITNYEQGNNKS
ncbi:MAG: restriction endonuclease subunit S [Saprospiraceae bacterium]